MARMLKGQLAQRSVATGVFVAVFVTASAGQAGGQVASGEGHTYTYRGPATISVATLRIPASAWKHFEKARLLAVKHRPAESEKESAKALAIAPTFAAAHILQASQQLALKDYTGAIANVDAARKSEPDAQWSGLILAGAYNSLHRYGDAMDVILGLDGSEAESWQAKYEHARAAIGLGDVDEALKWSSEAYETAPRDFTDAILMRANALMLAKHWAEASDKLYAYLAKPGSQPHREDAQTALDRVTQRMKAEHKPQGVTLASR
jgi:tetratricopeptide (TPR) repeat protein